MTTLKSIFDDVNDRMEQIKEIALQDNVGEQNFILAGAMKNGPLHTATLPPEVFFKGGVFNRPLWVEEAEKTFGEDPIPTIIAISVPINLVRGFDENDEPITTDCIGIATIHRWAFRTGAYIMVGDEFMWEDNFNTELLRPFFAPLHAQLAQYG